MKFIIMNITAQKNIIMLFIFSFIIQITYQQEYSFNFTIKDNILIKWKADPLTSNNSSQKTQFTSSLTSESEPSLYTQYAILIPFSNSQSFKLNKIDQLPYSYSFFINNQTQQCNLIISSILTPIYAYSSIIANYKYIYLNQISVTSDNEINPSQIFISSQIKQTYTPFSSIFNISVLSTYQKQYSNSQIFFEWSNKIYSLNSFFYSKEPKCFFLTYPTTKQICQQHCSVKTISDFIQQNYLNQNIKQFTYKNGYPQAYLQAVLTQQFIKSLQQQYGIEFTINIKLTEQYSTSNLDFQIEAFQLRSNSATLQIFDSQQLGQYTNFQILVKNLYQHSILTKIQFQYQNNTVFLQKIVFLKSFEQQIVEIKIKNNDGKVAVKLLNDLQKISQIIYLNSIIKVEERNDQYKNKNQQVKTTQIDTMISTWIYILIGGLSLFIFCCVFIGCCICRKCRSTDANQNSSKQEVKAQISNENKQEKLEKKKMSKIIITTTKNQEIQFDQNVFAQDSGRSIKPDLQQNDFNLTQTMKNDEEKIEETMQNQNKQATNVRQIIKFASQQA